MAEHSHLVVGHVCIDQLDTDIRLGGTSFFAAVRAAAMGCSVTVHTACSEKTGDLLRSRLPPGVVVQHQLATRDTRFEFTGSRPDRLISYAGSLLPTPASQFRSAHLGPIADEIPASVVAKVWDCADFVGVTAQGFMRRIAASGRLSITDISDYELVLGADAVVVNEDEFAVLQKAGTFLTKFQGPVFVTRGERGAFVTHRGREVARWRPKHVQRSARPKDTIGAGDVFASTTFVLLAQDEPLQTVLAASVEAATEFVQQQLIDAS